MFSDYPEDYNYPRGDYDDEWPPAWHRFELEDFMDRPWIWPGYGSACLSRPWHVPRVSDLELAAFMDNNDLGLSDSELYEVGCAIDPYDDTLIELFATGTVASIWEYMQTFSEERAAWKRALRYNIDIVSASNGGHVGREPVFYKELARAVAWRRRAAVIAAWAGAPWRNPGAARHRLYGRDYDAW